jgi:hypothetical protein
MARLDFLTQGEEDIEDVSSSPAIPFFGLILRR